MKRKYQYEVEQEAENMRLDQYITKHCMDLSRSYIQKLIQEERVTINEHIQVKNKTPVQIGDKIEVSLPTPKELNIQPQNIPLDILYEDDDLLIVNKPKNMVVHPSVGHFSGTLVNAKTIRFEPTAVLSDQDIKDVISRMDEALADTKKTFDL